MTFATLIALALMQPASAGPDIPGLCAQLAATGANTPAEQHNLATCHYAGVAVDQDFPRARELYEQAARRGHGKAQCALGRMLMRGLGGEEDAARGVILCRAGAEDGDADAQAELGRLYLAGAFGVERDPAAARRWLLRAAEQGEGGAALLLGRSYWNSEDGGRDAAAAARWGEVAYVAGEPSAALLVGQALVFALSEAGPPEEADPAAVDAAILWFTRAAEIEPDTEKRQVAVRMLARLRDIREGLE
ncbi:MAG: sel1 repeat family protein [Sphingomonadales bacterium]|nr:sel1 repeat family protein [Sphingomonadales bacterium]